MSIKDYKCIENHSKLAKPLLPPKGQQGKKKKRGRGQDREREAQKCIKMWWTEGRLQWHLVDAAGKSWDGQSMEGLGGGRRTPSPW